MPYSLGLALAACAVALFAAPFAMRAARALGALDQPGARRVHAEPVPRLGGLAMALGVLGVAWLARALPGPARELDPRPLLGLTVAALPILGLGMADDVHGVRPLVKILFQALAGVVLVAFGYGVPEITNPFGAPLHASALSAPLTVLWVVIVTNAINLIDGLDGLAAGVVTIAAATLWWVGRMHGDFYVMFLAALLIGATLGFLRWNFPPARLFMGDTGSHFLGLVLAAASLLENRKGTTTVTLLFPLVAMGLPIADSVLAFGRRLLAGQPVFRADSEHIHHRLLRLGLSPRGTLFALWGLCAALGALAVLLARLPREQAGLYAGALAAALLLAFEVLDWIGERREAERRAGSESAKR
ncbi:MAG TPA: MraY family glycosyltransferase [Candidatus Saccharimonadaceae bacterium]|nr:MraY family glycosyltransferase [Candidatus Saccharimonadaceae bacterium]